jgi:hypothetical protein
MIRRRLLALTLSATAMLAACGDDSVVGGSTAATSTQATAPAAAPTVVLRYVTDGGCVVLGPNCPTYTVWSDGKVEISRTHVDGPAEITGNVSPDRVAQWFASVQGLDVAVLAAKVGPGVCNSCVDGADIVATIELPDGPVVLDSTKLAFDPTDPTFAALGSLIAEVQAVGELPIRNGN